MYNRGPFCTHNVDRVFSFMRYNDFVHVQNVYNAATGRMELKADTEATIFMKITVPIAFPRCQHLAFQYDHPASGVETNGCEVYFTEGRSVHEVTIQAEPTPGHRSYTSLMKFKPYNKPPALMWENYVLDNITVKHRSLSDVDRFVNAAN